MVPQSATTLNEIEESLVTYVQNVTGWPVVNMRNPGPMPPEGTPYISFCLSEQDGREHPYAETIENPDGSFTETLVDPAVISLRMQATGDGAYSALNLIRLLIRSAARPLDLLANRKIGLGGFSSVQTIPNVVNGEVVPVAAATFMFNALLVASATVDAIEKLSVTITPDGDATQDSTFTVPEDPYDPDEGEKLPAGFQRLEYMLFLRSPSLFMTDIVLDDDTGVWVDYSPRLDIPYVIPQPYFGVAFGASSNTAGQAQSFSVARQYPIVNQNGFMYWGWRYISIANIPVDNQRHQHAVNWIGSNTVDWDDVAKATIPSTPGNYVSFPLTIGGSNYSPTYSNFFLFSGEIYCLKVSRGDQIVRDFVPCLDNNGVLCWYCLLTGYIARRKEFSGATWPDPGPVIPALNETDAILTVPEGQGA